IKRLNNVVLNCFIEYHLDDRARPAQYHLDWELSMTDYLGETHQDTTSIADQRAMQTLSRQQRYQLISALERQFTQ
ncbi:MAG: hypothetical protein AAFY17_18020, partial [Cyanobacteria bacterium J06642_11]